MLEYRAELLRFLLARRAAEDEAQDILQDLFIKVGTLQCGPIGEPRAYLYKMTANLLFDRRRSAARRANRERDWTQAQLGSEEEIDASPSVEQSMIARDELARVSAAIAALPERTAEVLRLYRIDEVAQKDIALRIGISLSAVEKHLQRAYRAVSEIRARLDAETELAWRPSGDDGSDVS